MKKIILACFLVLMVQILAPLSILADEVIDVRGNTVPCKIETIVDGFIEYHKDGNLYKFVRTEESPIFNDYVDVRTTKRFKEIFVERIPGKIVYKDMWGARIKRDGQVIDIPWYKVKAVGVYKPD